LLVRFRVQERPGKWCHRFWQEGGGYDRNVRTMEEAIEKARYCHHNPVTSGLVARPEQWNWSSYRWIELGVRAGAPLACDEWEERRTARRH
jgi:putative transposase